MHFADRQTAVFLAVSLALLRLAGCAPGGAVREEGRDPWVERTLARLSLDQKIGQMIMVRGWGYYYSGRSDEYERLTRLVKDVKVGGIMFSQGDVFETAALANQLQRMSDVPLLVAADFEWGAAMRIRRATRFPEAMALGATRDTPLAYAMGRAVAQETRAIGVQQDFAPVADVNVNPDNPVINTRSFGEDPQLVAVMATAFADGLQGGGVLATAKHFPGHGDTQTDSHLSLPVIPHSRSRLDSVELYPYHRLINHGIASVMVGHLEVPALEGSENLPASLSPPIVNGILRHDLGYGGLVVTDALDMGAIVGAYGTDSAVVKAVEAGIDILLIPSDERVAIDAVRTAVLNGTIPQARIDESVRRILMAKRSLGLNDRRLVNLDSIRSCVATPEHLQLARDIARRSITLLSGDSLLPISRYKKILTVVVADDEHYRTPIDRPGVPWPNEPVGDYFTAQLKRRTTGIQMVRLDPTSNQLDFDAVMKKARWADLILLPIYSKTRSGSGSFGLPDILVRFVDTLTWLDKPAFVASMGSPYVVSAFPSAAGALCAYSDCEVSTEATVEALFGEIPLTGKLPVTIPGMFAYGSGVGLMQQTLRRDAPESEGFNSDSLAALDNVLTRAVRDSAFPGAQLLIAREGTIVYNRSFGRLDYSPQSARVDNTTIYDLASLTKVFATTSAIMKLLEEGKLGLDDRVVEYIPAFGNNGKNSLTIRNLLLHNGGLPPFKRLFLTCTSPSQVLDSVYQTELIYRPGDSTAYSDFDFIVLGKIVESISGVSVARYVDSVFFKPLGMTRTMYTPPSYLLDDIAPTEYDTLYRHILVRGVVHDENAYALGGISGHAGLFSTASDLAMYMQMLMNGGTYGGRRYLKPETVSLFTSKQTPGSTRALGWDTKTVGGYSSAGSLFSPLSFGHTGFTGTSVWADPEKKIFVIFLTNRVYPTRANSKIMQVRPLVHDAVMRALTGIR